MIIKVIIVIMFATLIMLFILSEYAHKIPFNEGGQEMLQFSIFPLKRRSLSLAIYRHYDEHNYYHQHNYFNIIRLK